MAEKIDPTWLAYALRRPAGATVLSAATERLLAHYREQVDYPMAVSSATTPYLGLVCVGDAEPASRWPAFAASGDRVVASAYPVAGWRRVAGEGVAMTDGPQRLGAAIAADPAVASRKLPAPVVLGVLERSRRRLTIVNDFIGVGRLYEYSFADGTVWSNRAVAPFLFSGHPAELDERGLRILSAAMWPVGLSTPFKHLSKVPGGTVIEATPDGVSAWRTGAIGPLVTGRRSRRLGSLARKACEAATQQALDAAELWPGAINVDLSGGRDSRVVAAAAVHAGLDARYLTSDVTPGEAAIARRVVASSPVQMTHLIRKGEGHLPRPHELGIRSRALNVHLLHDGMRHPQKARGKNTMPRARPAGAVMSGHGGDVAHGFFYKSWRQYAGIRHGGEQAVRDRIERLFAKDHGAAQRRSYDAALAEAERLLGEAEEHGVRTPTELEFFYFVDRFAHRQGLGASVERVSIFGTQEFVEAAFAQRPRDRLSSRLHALMIGQLVPQWADVPFFRPEASSLRYVRRLRIWESRADVEDFEDVLAQDGLWSELFDVAKVRQMWQAARADRGRASWEGLFETLVYIAALADFLDIVNTRANAGPALYARSR